MYTKLVREMREAVSPKLVGRDALDKLMLKIEPVIVERFYPKQYKARCILRNTYNSENQIAITCDIGMIGLTDKIRIQVVPKKKESEVCPYTGWDSVIPEDYIIGLILAVSGDLANGSILLLYTNMYDTEEFPEELDGDIYLKNNNSYIRIGEDRIDITSPNLYLNGEEYGG